MSKMSRFPHCCKQWSCRRPSSKVLASLATVRCKPSSSVHIKGGLQPSIQVKTSSHQGSDHSEQLCQSDQKLFPQRSIDLSPRKVGSRTSPGPVFSSLLQPAVFSPQTGKQVEAYFRSESVEQVPQNRHIQDGNSGNHPDLSTKSGVGNLAGFQRCILSHPHSPLVEKVHEVLPEQTNVPVHCPSLRVGHSSSRVHQGGQGGEAYGSEQGYKNPPVPRRLVTESPFKGDWSTSHPSSVVSLLINIKKSELTPQQVFTFVGYWFDLLTGRVLPTQESWASLRQKLLLLKTWENCTVRQFMSLIGLLTATENQVWLGRLHMRPIQWHLKRHWQVPEVLEKVIPLPPSLHPHLDWWLDEGNVLRDQPLHPLSHALQLFTDASNEGWGAHLRDSTTRGVWSEVESQLHINFLELKAFFLALGSLELLCRNQIVLVATDNTAVVAYINKKGGMKSGSHCALLWRLLSWCHPRGIVLRARHIPGRLNVIANKLSRHNQVIQTEWSLDQSVFNLLCSRWALPQVDLFATRYNYKLPKFVSPVLDPTAWAVDALSLPWQDLDAYAFPPVSLLSQVISKIVDQGCRRMILIAPGWPNMAWFWDLVNLSVQIPFSLLRQRDLVTQPFSGIPHRDLSNLNLHAWLLEPPSFKEKDSLAKWQHELRHLRDSTRAVYKSKWAIFVKWCGENKVDFRSATLSHIADFLLYLFKERNLQPSTIDGYRTAIADMIGNETLNISKDENLTRLLDSFHRDQPKGKRGIPSWNLSLVLHQFTKAPFEPMRQASLKPLMFKTVFLLALGSGKQRSEIHA